MDPILFILIHQTLINLILFTYFFRTHPEFDKNAVIYASPIDLEKIVKKLVLSSAMGLALLSDFKEFDTFLKTRGFLKIMCSMAGSQTTADVLRWPKYDVPKFKNVSNSSNPENRIRPIEKMFKLKYCT